MQQKEKKLLLYIAEKPSVGREIAKELGVLKRGEGFIETKGGLVTWAFGHILRQAEPAEYDPKYKRWQASDLPIIPAKWQMVVSQSSRAQYEIIKSLAERADEIVNAGDPDREGQLLVDEILDYFGNKKPVHRLLLNALDAKSIQAALCDLRDNRDFYSLKQSALARARADWLVGFNLSRAFTLAVRFVKKDKSILPVGRVKTPTLALAVRRERELQNFKPVDYFVIKAEFLHENGVLKAVWQPDELQTGLDSEGRLVDSSVAEALLQKLKAEKKPGKVSAFSRQQKKEAAPLPFSLSSLQVMAGRRFGYEPQQVLDAAQRLYEKKLTSYPRSDCEYLPQNQFAARLSILNNLLSDGKERLCKWAQKADKQLKSRAWNDKKITAHHAIIPTTVKVNWEQLDAVEKNIYYLIARQYLAQFYPEYIFEQVRAQIDFAGEKFKVSGRTPMQIGWKELYQGEKKETVSDDGGDEQETLPAMKKGDAVQLSQAAAEKKTTKPPARFTAATLLAGMKNIHKYVQDAQVKKRLRSVSGIGTEATRANIIDELIEKGFLCREKGKKYLRPSEAAFTMIDVLPEQLTCPDFTARWEDYLSLLAQGEGSLEEFLRRQEEFVQEVTKKAAQLVVLGLKKGAACPRCGKGILMQRVGKNGPFWGCSAYPVCRYTCSDANGKPALTRPMAKPAVQAEENLVNTGFVSAWDLMQK